MESYVSDHVTESRLYAKTSKHLVYAVDTCPILGPLVPQCFGFLVTSPLGIKARVGLTSFAIFAEANLMVHEPKSHLCSYTCNYFLAYLVRQKVTSHMNLLWWYLARLRTCNRTNRRRSRNHFASDPAK